MSPFATFLRQLRIRRGLKQKALAFVLGYEPSYLSALERSQKGPPKPEFIQRLIRGLALSQDEQLELAAALEKSRRQFALPCAASLDEYELVRELAPRLGRLDPVQIGIIRQVLNLTPLGPSKQEVSTCQSSMEDLSMS